MIDPATILEFIQQQGYLFILLATIIEGPVIAAAAAFAASLGVFDPFTVLFLTIAGISVTDMLYFTLGHFGKLAIIDRVNKRKKLGNDKVAHITEHLKTHTFRMLLVIKLVPMLPTVGITAAGAVGITYRKFTPLALGITTGLSCAYVIFGYFFGFAFKRVLEYYNWVPAVSLLVVGAGIAGYVLVRYFRKIRKKYDV